MVQRKKVLHEQLVMPRCEGHVLRTCIGFCQHSAATSKRPLQHSIAQPWPLATHPELPASSGTPPLLLHSLLNGKDREKPISAE